MDKTAALPDLRSFTYEELEDFIVSEGEARFRAGQIFGWLHQKGAKSFDEMTNLSKPLREKLSSKSYISSARIAEKYVSKLDGTVKYLIELSDGECVETVVMRYHHGITICISSQVGCRMGCRFCASTIGGKKRDLLSGEIIMQIMLAQEDIGERISNIVMMGIGEPLDNFENVRRFLINVNDERGLNIGYRHISLSTCGLADGIDRLAKMNIPITLSISLHAPNDEIRSRTMPVNSKYNIDTLLAACRRYQAITTRRISFEYAMIDSVNDSGECARELAKRLDGILCHVNLIPVNNVSERDYKKSSRETIEKFIDILQKAGITATVRRELGSDISASCGQLRQKRL